MTTIYHQNGALAWNGSRAYHIQGQIAWDEQKSGYYLSGIVAYRKGRGFYESGTLAWDGKFVYNPDGTIMNSSSVKLDLGPDIFLVISKDKVRLSVVGQEVLD